MTSVRTRVVLTEDEEHQLFNDQLPLSGVVEREPTASDGISQIRGEETPVATFLRPDQNGMDRILRA